MHDQIIWGKERHAIQSQSDVVEVLPDLAVKTAVNTGVEHEEDESPVLKIREI